MQVKILKLWHTWGWLFHISAWLIGVTVMVCTYGNATASNTNDIAYLKEQHEKENLKERVAVQESITKDIRDDVHDIKSTQAAIFSRLNQIADKK